MDCTENNDVNEAQTEKDLQEMRWKVIKVSSPSPKTEKSGL